MKKMRPTTRRAKRTAQARASWSFMRVMQKAECRMQNGRGYPLLHSAFCLLHSLPPYLREKRLARHRPPEEPLHQVARRLLAAAAEDHLAEAAAGLGVRHVGAEGGDEVERDHLGPHVAV